MRRQFVEGTNSRELPMASDAAQALMQARLWSPAPSAVPIGSGDISSGLRIFADVTMRWPSFERIFGPALCILTYR